jgi:amino acid adenylation domain-containing protein
LKRRWTFFDKALLMDDTRTLRSGFLRSVERFGDRPALLFDGVELSFAQLYARAAALAATLQKHDPEPAMPLTAVFGHRSTTAFASVLAALLRGHGYVPLNPSFPEPRTQAMLQRSDVSSVIVDATAVGQLDAVLAGIERSLLVLAPDSADVSALAARFPQHRWLGASDVLSASALQPTQVDPNGIAYLLFTSGSTGAPKGVMVAHRNVTAFVDIMVERYGVTERDRFSQTFDLTFDLSAFDMFVSWERGACLCVPTAGQKMLPGKYITDAGISIWFSVPSTGVLMSRLRMLKAGKYPALRYSLFCGEALPIEIVQKWAEAAPSSVLENLYGPTELTIACTLYRWDNATSPAESELGVVPIGEPYPGMTVLVCDEQLREVPPGETGELLMTGPQLSLGYFRDQARTDAAFVRPPGQDRVFYRTGDRVRRPLPGKPLVYLGRMDYQIKIQGYRVELGEIEAVLREEAGVELAIAIGWPQTPSGADGVVAFIAAGGAVDPASVRERAMRRLPPYMHPSEVRAIETFPLNANGKVDRKALAAMLGEKR